MQLLTVTNEANGERRYFINGKRVSRLAYDMARGRNLSCFVTRIRGGLIRQYCNAA